MGRRIAYTPDAPVWHGHDESFPVSLRRSLVQSVLRGQIRLRSLASAANLLHN